MARSRSGTRGRRGPRKPRKRNDNVQATVQVADPATRGAVEIPEQITVKELAELIGINSADVIRELIRSGIFATINQAIGQNGIIQGNFSDAELSYLTRVLAAGALEARLTPDPIAINTLGPSIGKDNLNRGIEAFLVALCAVAVFMMIYYFFAGMVADFALVANGVIIFGWTTALIFYFIQQVYSKK